MTKTTTPDPKLVALWETLAAEQPAGIDQRTRASQSHPISKAMRGFSLSGLPRLDAQGIEPGEVAEFRVERTLGEGGMGIVRLARQNSLYRDVAIKTSRVGHTSTSGTNDLLREAWVTGLLEHPNIIPIHSVGIDEHGAPMIVMKMVEGVSWAEALLTPEKLPAALRTSHDTVETHLQILFQVCHAVHFAHSKGIVHRDLKPENVMLGAYGEVYVVDWGISVSLRDDGTGRFILAKDITDVEGTPAYIAPEMAMGAGHMIDERTDVYLLGAVLHELISSTPRHNGNNVVASLVLAHASQPVAYGNDVDPELGAIANRSTAKDRDDRFQSVEEFRLAIVDYLCHRDSRELVHEAQIQLAKLKQEIHQFKAAHPAKDKRISETPSRHLYELFAQIRFGFEQGLRVWEGNVAARQGLVEALTTMADLEIVLGDEKAASLLLAELDAPPQHLVERLDELRANLGAELDELDELRRMRRENDLTLASRERAKLVFFLGIFLGVLPLINSALVRYEIMAYSFQNYFTQYALVLIGVGVVVLKMRSQVIRNGINYRLIVGIFVILLGGLIARLLGFQLGLDVAACTALEGGWYAAGVMLMAVFIDKRLLPAAGAFALGAFAMAAWPAWVLEIDAASNSGALWLAALAWWMQSDQG